MPYLRVLTRTPFFAHSTPKLAAICLTAACAGQQTSSIRPCRAHYVKTRTGLGSIVGGLGLRDVDDLDGVWGISRSSADG